MSTCLSRLSSMFVFPLPKSNVFDWKGLRRQEVVEAFVITFGLSGLVPPARRTLVSAAGEGWDHTTRPDKLAYFPFPPSLFDLPFLVFVLATNFATFYFLWFRFPVPHHYHPSSSITLASPNTRRAYSSSNDYGPHSRSGQRHTATQFR